MHVIARDTIVDGRYRAQKRLGSGGMAEVWCAEDEVLGRRVALKLLGGRFVEDPEFRERFRREAQAAAGLTHPNIVGVFDRSEWEGTPYIAMELVDGRTLKELVQERGPVQPTIAVNLIEQILGALGYAHRRGIVHRDIKPQNVILDDEGQAKVADFGIARAGHSEMTETGAMIGTVQYLSPEQAQGQPVDRRSDLYSAGVVLYELLTGRVPFDGEAPVSIALKHVSERPVPPSQLSPGIPPSLEAVVMRSLEKDPARRYQSAEEFIAALEAARRAPARQVVLEPAPGEPWVEDSETRSRWWIWLLVALLLAAIAAGAWFLLAGNRVDVPRVIGRNASDAADILHRRGLEVNFKNVESATVPRDDVVAQNPDPGARVKEGTSVLVSVSAGPGTAAVPPVGGLTRAQAEKALADAGFNHRVRLVYSSSVPAGKVISADPEAGRQLQKGRTVLLTVSRGIQGVPVPKVVGLQRAEAERQLQAAGLTANVTEQETTQPAGTVMKQDPPSGTTVEKGSAVKLTVAKQRPEVPDVSTQNPTVEEATKTLEDAGFKVQTRDRAGDPALAGKVVGQSPPAGTRRSTGATVVLFVVPTATPTPTPTPTATPTP